MAFTAYFELGSLVGMKEKKKRDTTREDEEGTNDRRELTRGVLGYGQNP
jgi:hypothetical protein